MLAGFSAVVWLNVRPTEIESACNLLKVPRRIRDQVTEDVQFLASVAARINNDENKKARRR